jgi:hypothetical protein
LTPYCKIILPFFGETGIFKVSDNLAFWVMKKLVIVLKSFELSSSWVRVMQSPHFHGKPCGRREPANIKVVARYHIGNKGEGEK